MRRIEVLAEWDAEAKVWVATSKDVEGLITEAATVEALLEKLYVMVPELLEANGGGADSDVREVPFSLIARSEQVISLRG